MIKTKQQTTVAEAQAAVIAAEAGLKRAHLKLELAQAEYLRVWHRCWDGTVMGANDEPVDAVAVG